jgi:1,4-dihydroxy-2-naphthoate octaprenyltransferase
MMLAFEFPDYASDVKFGKATLLVRMGWRQGMRVHNALVLGGFILLGVCWALGLPLRIALPGLLVLPIGALQVWMMNRIEDGAKPNWTLFTMVAAATFGLTAYVLTYGFWTR